MRLHPIAFGIFLAISSFAAVAGLPESRRAAAEAWTKEGLQAVKSSELDLVFQAPGASLAGYRQLLLSPPVVDFRKNFERDSARWGGHRPTDEDLQKLRDRLTAVLREQAAKELKAGGYAIVDKPGPGVLAVDCDIVDLFLAAPDNMAAMRTRTLAYSAGEMTLVAEMRDSASGKVLARAFDQAHARETVRLHPILSGENEVEMRRIARKWAQVLRAALDGKPVAKQ